MKGIDALLKRFILAVFCMLAAGFLFAQNEEAEEPVPTSEEEGDKYSLLMQSASDTLYDTAAYFRASGYTADSSGWKEEIRGLDYREFPPEPEEPETPYESPLSMPSFNFNKLNTWLGYGGLTLLLGLLAFLIFLVLREAMKEWTKEEEMPFSLASNPEKWTGSELEELLRKALAEGNRPSALRVMFLLSLKELNALGFVRWKKNKTNAHYLREIENPEIRRSFRLLSIAFDAARYGGYPVSDAAFARIGEEFHSLKSFLEPFRPKESRP
jgi:hypothetical protein